MVYCDETIWSTQTAVAELYDCSTDNIGLYLKNIYAEGEFSDVEKTKSEKLI